MATTLNPELKPRPLTLAEIAWDVFPHIAGCLFLLWLAHRNRGSWPPPEKIPAALTPICIALGYVVSIGHAVMMQFSGHALLRRITLREWRESLWLAGIPPRAYLVSQLKSRAIFQSIPFAVGPIFATLAAGFGITLLREEKTPFAAFGFGTALIYGLFCLQFCACCAAHLGHLNRLRFLCRPNASELPLYFISLKWIAIIAISPPVNAGIGGLLGEIAAGLAEIAFGMTSDMPASLSIRAATVCVYSVIMCTLISIFLYRRLRDSWKKAQEEFYSFE